VSEFVNAAIVTDLLLKINLSASIISIVDPACNATQKLSNQNKVFI
jgi:hypothetical protein